MKKLIPIAELVERLRDSSVPTSFIRDFNNRCQEMLSRLPPEREIIRVPIMSLTELEILALTICSKFSLKSCVDLNKVVHLHRFPAPLIFDFNIEYLNGEAYYLDVEEFNSLQEGIGGQ